MIANVGSGTNVLSDVTSLESNSQPHFTASTLEAAES